MRSNDDNPPTKATPPRRIHYLTASDLYSINFEVTGGDTFVRDLHLLDSAVNRPKLALFGQAQFPTLIDKAASLLHSLAYHHLFVDGNKRTAALALAKFLEINGVRLTWDAATGYDFILEIAQGKHEVEEIAARLAKYVDVKIDEQRDAEE
jgi:death-on-curing protein